MEASGQQSQTQEKSEDTKAAKHELLTTGGSGNLEREGSVTKGPLRTLARLSGVRG